VASNGVGPYSYQVIGSFPSIPSINSTPQASPIFNIDNGIKYSLIRLRALDACGNATLGDASILPLANYKMEVDSNCFQSSSTLSVDTFYNSTYAWFKKENFNSTDSTYLGGGYSVHLPFLSASDTGTYVCHVTVNTGCVKRSFVYNLNGLCYNFLPVKVTSFTGKFENEGIQLSWNSIQEAGLKNFIIERKNRSGIFTAIGNVIPKTGISGTSRYGFTDRNPLPGMNSYRLKLFNDNNSFSYTNTILLNKDQTKSIHCYPNPVSNMLTVDFGISTKHVFKIILLNLTNQGVWETTFTTGNNKLLQIVRPQSLGKGIYLLRCIDTLTNEEYAEKVILL